MRAASAAAAVNMSMSGELEEPGCSCGGRGHPRRGDHGRSGAKNSDFIQMNDLRPPKIGAPTTYTYTASHTLLPTLVVSPPVAFSQLYLWTHQTHAQHPNTLSTMYHRKQALSAGPSGVTVFSLRGLRRSVSSLKCLIEKEAPNQKQKRQREAEAERRAYGGAGARGARARERR